MKVDNIKVFLFNTAGGWLDSTIHLATAFVLNPVIINSLGAYYFGIWQVLFQLIAYLTAADLQPGTTLKWYVSKHKSVNDFDDISRKFSASIFVTIGSIPIYLLVAICISYFLPTITQSSEEDMSIISLTFYLLILTFIINQFSFITKSLFVGMNLSYRRIGIQSVSTIAVGVLSYIFLIRDMGITGLGIAAVIGALLMLALYYWLTRHVFYWLRLIKIKTSELWEFISINSEYLLLKVSSLLSESFDLLLLAYFLGPAEVASYSLTLFTAKGLRKFIQEFTTAYSPGLSIARAESSSSFISNRETFILINWLAIGMSFPILIVINESFLSLWVGPDVYLGDLENLLIYLIVIFKLTRGLEVAVISMTLRVKEMASINIVVSVITILVSLVLVPKIGITGLLLPILGSVVFTNYAFYRMTNNVIEGYKSQFYNRGVVLAFFWIVTAFLMSWYWSFDMSWLRMIVYACTGSLFIFLSFWLTVFTRVQRSYILRMLSNNG